MKNLLYFFLIAIITNNTFGQEGFTTRNVATGLDTPWEILWGPDNYIWMTERYGRISRVNPETGDVSELVKISDVFEDGERGLMGMVLHPDFEDNPYVYTVYTYHAGNGETYVRLIRLTYDGNKLSDPLTFLDSIRGAWNHDGSRLLIDENLKLFMTMGDAAEQASAQDYNVLNGKVLRLNLDGSIPNDNPDPVSYIWSAGHRNPQGLVKANGIIYSSEHGPANDDELNIIEKGRNYGWPYVQGFCDKSNEMSYCEQLDVVEPLAAWTPTLAVAGIDYYNHHLISEWDHSILMVVLKSSRLVQMKLSEDGRSIIEENHFFTNQYGRLRDICISLDGRVFIATSNKDGRGSPASVDDRIIEIKPASSAVDRGGRIENELEIFPNPFNDEVQIINSTGKLKSVEIFNPSGLMVKNFLPGKNSFTWDGRDQNSNLLPSGIYYIRYNENGATKTQKIMFTK